MPDSTTGPTEFDLATPAGRALSEAAGRKAKTQADTLPTELGGREGPDPVRFGDWENKGLAVDF